MPQFRRVDASTVRVLEDDGTTVRFVPRDVANRDHRERVLLAETRSEVQPAPPPATPDPDPLGDLVGLLLTKNVLQAADLPTTLRGRSR